MNENPFPTKDPVSIYILPPALSCQNLTHCRPIFCIILYAYAIYIKSIKILFSVLEKRNCLATKLFRQSTALHHNHCSLLLSVYLFRLRFSEKPEWDRIINRYQN